MSPAPHTNRGRSDTVSKPVPVGGDHRLLGARLGGRVERLRVGPARRRLVHVHERLAGHQGRLGAAMHEAAHARLLGRLEGVARADHVPALELLGLAPLTEVGGEVERDARSRVRPRSSRPRRRGRRARARHRAPATASAERSERPSARTAQPSGHQAAHQVAADEPGSAGHERGLGLRRHGVNLPRRPPRARPARVSQGPEKTRLNPGRCFLQTLDKPASDRRGSHPAMSGSLESLRELNRLRIVDALRHDGTASRADIARQTGLSPSTVSTVIAELQRAGLVVESTLAPAGRQGRPPAQLALDPSAGAAVGIDFDHDKIRVAVSDLARTVLAEASVRLDVDHDAPRALEHASELVAQVLDEAGVDSERVLGAGMALPGPVDHARGALHSSPILSGWATWTPPRSSSSGSTCRCISTTTPTSARSPRSRSAPGATFASAAYIQMSSGIGAGLIVDGRALPRAPRDRRRDRPRARRGAGTDLPLRQPRLPRDARLGARRSWRCSPEPRRRADRREHHRHGPRRRPGRPPGDRRRRPGRRARWWRGSATCSTPRWSWSEAI